MASGTWVETLPLTSVAHLMPAPQGPSSTMTTCFMDASAQSPNWELQVTLLPGPQGEPPCRGEEPGPAPRNFTHPAAGDQKPRGTAAQSLRVLPGSVKLKRRLHAARPTGRGHSDPESHSSKPDKQHRGISLAPEGAKGISQAAEGAKGISQAPEGAALSRYGQTAQGHLTGC